MKHKVRSVAEIKKAIKGLKLYLGAIDNPFSFGGYKTLGQIEFAEWVLVPVKPRRKRK